MTRIGLISDTHGFLDDRVFEHFTECNEIWHAGDIGTIEVSNRLRAFRPLRAVFGNIDGADIRAEFPERLIFSCEKVRVFIKHIGGYPPNYNPETKKELKTEEPQLFICGHSHILKVMYDPNLKCLHMNPGAAGKQGWQKVRTVVRFAIDGDNITQCEVIELGKVP